MRCLVFHELYSIISNSDYSCDITYTVPCTTVVVPHKTCLLWNFRQKITKFAYQKTAQRGRLVFTILSLKTHFISNIEYKYTRQNTRCLVIKQQLLYFEPAPDYCQCQWHRPASSSCYNYHHHC